MDTGERRFRGHGPWRIVLPFVVFVLHSLPLFGWVVDGQQAVEGLRELQTYFREQNRLWELANAYAAAGRKDEALRTLLQGVPTHEPGLLQIRVDPDFDNVRDDARYAELVRQIGFPSE